MNNYAQKVYIKKCTPEFQKESKIFFSQIAVEALKVSGEAYKLLGFVLSLETDKKFTVKSYSELFGISRPTVIKCIDELVASGFCNKFRIGINLNEYYFFFAPDMNPNYSTTEKERKEFFKSKQVNEKARKNKNRNKSNSSVNPIDSEKGSSVNPIDSENISSVNPIDSKPGSVSIRLTASVNPIDLITIKNKKNNTLLSNNNNVLSIKENLTSPEKAIIQTKERVDFFEEKSHNSNNMKKEIQIITKLIQEEIVIQIGCLTIEQLPEFFKDKINEDVISERWEKFTKFYNEKNSMEFTSWELCENITAIHEFGNAIVEQCLNLWKNQHPDKIPAKEKQLLFYLLRKNLHYEPSIILFDKFINKIISDNEYDKRPIFIWSKAYTSFTGGEEANREENKKQADIAEYSQKRRKQVLADKKIYEDLHKKEPAPISATKKEEGNKFVKQQPNYGFVDEAFVKKIKDSLSA